MLHPKTEILIGWNILLDMLSRRCKKEIASVAHGRRTEKFRACFVTLINCQYFASFLTVTMLLQTILVVKAEQNICATKSDRLRA